MWFTHWLENQETGFFGSGSITLLLLICFSAINLHEDILLNLLIILTEPLLSVFGDEDMQNIDLPLKASQSSAKKRQNEKKLPS